MKQEDLAELEDQVYDAGDGTCADVLERVVLTLIKENGDLTNEVERLQKELGWFKSRFPTTIHSIGSVTS